MDVSVFYAWQSDLASESNRSFIRKALERALRDLKREFPIEDSPRLELQLDHDTKGVPGIPEIARTIFEKINGCGIFVADLSYVANVTNVDGIQKRLPNSNVVLELGYAMSAVGTDRIICVVNEACGTIDELFFDLAHRRRPICYTLHTKDDAAKEEILTQLTTQLRSAIKTIVEIRSPCSPK